MAAAVPHFRAAIAALHGTSGDEPKLELAHCYEILGTAGW
jgi:hypothetical protein